MESCAIAQTQDQPCSMPVDIVQPVDQPITGPQIQNIGSFIFSGIQFKELFGSLSAINSDVRMHFDNESMYCRVVDNANVAMVEAQYNKTAFESFKINKPIAIGIDVSSVYGLRTMIKKGSLIAFDIEEKIIPATTKDQKETSILYYSVSIEGCTTRYTGLDTISMRRDPNTPTINLDTKVELIASDLIQGIKDLKKITEKVAFTFDQGVFTMIGEGDTTTMKKIVDCYKYTPGIPAARALYSWSYLNDISKTLDKKDVISFEFKTDHPLRIKKDDGYREITFLLAPRIETD
jgi:proliferating cell nuclear antigen